MLDNAVTSRVKEKDCCGCGACVNKCPFDALVMKENDEGFLHPSVNESKCKDCPKSPCLKVCPSLNSSYANFDEPFCYAAMAEDSIRMNSSSGGVFTLIAESILERGGVVCGAAYDDMWEVHHILVDNTEDLSKLKFSKYVQSNTEDCYKKIKKYLTKGVPVLFSGCPCQVAGLYGYLGIDYDTLYTMDLICHGVPSRKLWREYVKENFGRKTISDINFRDKSVFGWAVAMNVYFADGTEIHKPPHLDPYLRGFNPCMTLNKHCSSCLFSRLPRQGDLSVGDWWGIDAFVKGLNDRKGTSQVLINNKKGEALYSSISSKLKVSYNIGLQTTIKSINKTIYTPFRVHRNRERFFKEFKMKKNGASINKILNDNVDNHYDILLITTFFAKNYGAILVAYAVNRILSDLGYSVLMLQKPSFVWPGYPISGTMPANFASQHYNISRQYNDTYDLISLNRHCTTFVVGSDQLFSPLVFPKYTFQFLDFVEAGKKKLAFGTSFGNNRPRLENENRVINILLRRFSGLALRDNGAEICRDKYNIDAETVIDPTLMLPVEFYNELADKADDKSIPERPYVVTYLLDANDEKVDLAERIANQIDAVVLNIPNPEERHRKKSRAIYLNDVTPERFLYLFRHAALVLTDSFHGTCFSIKFEKPFVSLVNRQTVRFELFRKMGGVSDRIYKSISDVAVSDNLYKIDYTKARCYINEMTLPAINWIKAELQEDSKTNEDFKTLYPYYDLEIKKIASENKLLLARLQNTEAKYEKLSTRLQLIERGNLSEGKLGVENLSLIVNRVYIYRKYYVNYLFSLLPFPFSKKFKNRRSALHEFVQKLRKSKKYFRRVLRHQYHSNKRFDQ